MDPIDQVALNFNESSLRYRPVLDNTRLKTEFGYTPELTTAQAFDLFQEGRNT